MQRSVHGGVNLASRKNSLLKRLNVIYFVFKTSAFILFFLLAVLTHSAQLSRYQLMYVSYSYSCTKCCVAFYQFNASCYGVGECVSFMPFSITLTHAPKTFNAYSMRYKIRWLSLMERKKLYAVRRRAHTHTHLYTRRHAERQEERPR